MAHLFRDFEFVACVQEEAFVRKQLQLSGKGRDSADEAPFGSSCKKLEAFFLPYPVACQVGERTGTSEVLLQETGHECLWLRGGSDHHVAVQYRFPHGSGLRER